MTQRILGALVAFSLLVGAMSGAATAPAAAAVPGGFRNPITSAADPHVSYFRGYYYSAQTDDRSIFVRRATTLGELLVAPPVRVWSDSDPSRNQHVWAPAFFLLNDRWYMYYTADNGIDDQHRMYVLESTATASAGATPASAYAFKAKVYDPGNDRFAIDGIPFMHNGRMYFIWAGSGPEGPSNLLYLAGMSNPYTLSTPRVYLPAGGACPEVREAPATLSRNGRTWLVYSTCDTGKPDYQLWMKSIADVDNPLAASKWFDHGPVFRRNDEVGVYGPGSNSFFKSPDGTEDWIAYHAKTTTAFTYAGRTGRAQRFTWNPDGSPSFMTPLAIGATQNVPRGDPNTGPAYSNDTSAGFGPEGTIKGYTGKCVDVDQGNSANGTRVQLYDCNGDPAQRWTIAADGTVRALGKCLDIDGNSTQNFAKIQLWDCNGVGGQQWRPRANGSLRNPQSGRCLDDPGGNDANFTQLMLYDCNGLDQQKWTIPRATGQFHYEGPWSYGTGCAVQCFFGDDHASGSAGASVTYTFYGTRIALFSVKDTGNGIAAISVDGGAETDVDFYAPIRSGEELQYLSRRLPLSNHTLRVRVTGRKNPASWASVISTDRIEIYR